jgi:RNA polymerase sigma factor (TIGR02999 family)
MSSSPPSRFKVLAAEARLGSEEARDQLILLVYQDLRRLAQHYLKHERANHTLQATALAHEVYLKLFGKDQVAWPDWSHFFIIAARQMRRILIDHSRAAAAGKRNGNGRRVPLEEAAKLPAPGNVDLIALNEALEALERVHPRMCKVVELRYFGGLTEEETAKVLGVSATTVKREWQFAKTWLYDEIGGAD